MCGICGLIYLDGRPIPESLVKSLADTLRHRGPDEEGYYLNPRALGQGETGPSVALGHRRLSIIDLSSGKQPLANEDKTVWIVFNGEIYNFQDLREELQKRGHKFRTRSDTETIVHAYEEWREDCVERLRGMFAFAIWDEQRKRLFLARDRLGIKPLYYYLDPGKFLFASEIKAILAEGNVPREINLEALADYLSLLYVPAPKSMFRNIFKLPPGHTLSFSPEGMKVRQYWDIDFSRVEERSEEEWAEALLEKLTEAVKIRLVAEVPLGAFLSGGVDSSAVVAIMAQLLSEPVITNSIGFREETYSELPYAREVAKRFHTNHHEYIVTPEAIKIVDLLAYYFDEPFADSSAIPTYYVSKVARENVTVALSGDGGDENFAGYRRYYFDRLENKLRDYLPGLVRHTLIAAAARVYPKADWLPRPLRAKYLLTNLSLSPARAFFNSVAQLLPGEKEKLLHPEVKNSLTTYDTALIFEDYYQRATKQTADPLSRVQYVDIKTYLVDDILTKVDRASMAHALEVRVPILDHEFMELVSRIPSFLKLKGRQSKYIFKKALSKYLPWDFLNRPKQGFVIPLAQWFRKELKELTEDIILAPSSQEFFNVKYLKKIWSEHQGGLRDHSAILWAILMFQKWKENWL